MKRLILVFGLIVTCSIIYGQENKLIYNKNIPDTERRAAEILQRSDAFVSVNWVGIDLEKISVSEQFVLQFGKRNLTVHKSKIEKRGINNFCFVGQNEEGVIIVMSVIDNDIQGVIETIDGVYDIKTTGKDEYIIVKVDQSKMKEACMRDHEDNRHDDLEEIDKTDSLDTNDTILQTPFTTRAGNNCKIRVLVLYTSAAQNSVSNIKNTILSAIDISNQSFINSNINYQLELTYAGLTNYTESNSMETDRNRFRNKNDNYMDEVHSLRDKYFADVCVLLVNSAKNCGISYIGISENDAFCVVSTTGSCMSSNYSFVHEIGHLLGCRHDPYVDSNTTPFAYGHGYVYSPGNWRTIMAYSNACSSCIRRQYWSNPNVTYGGVPMGTVSTNNNVRVWNEQSEKIMGFRQPENNVVISGSDILSSTIQADIVAKQTITTSGNVDVTNNKTITMRAGNSITLKPGFTVSSGSVFSAKIENVSDCGLSPITVASWIDAVCRGNALRFNVTNATNYYIEVRKYAPTYSLVYSSSGSITGNPVTVWNVPSSLSVDDYSMYISFSSPYYEEYRKSNILVWACRGNDEIENDEIMLTTVSDDHFDFNIYPNPNDGNFTLTVETKEIQPFFVEIFDSFGALVSKTEYSGVYQVNINHTGLLSGVYLVKLSMNNHVSTKKIVVQ